MRPAAAEGLNQVWAYDFVADRTRDARKFRMRCVVDGFTREALAIKVARRLDSDDVIEVLAELCLARGVPEHVRSDQGPEFMATALKAWIKSVGSKAAYIEKASPWENGYVESFNGKLRDELLEVEIFNSLREAQVLIESWRHHYHAIRPHSALGYRRRHPRWSCPPLPCGRLRHAASLTGHPGRGSKTSHALSPPRASRWGPAGRGRPRPAAAPGVAA